MRRRSPVARGRIVAIGQNRPEPPPGNADLAMPDRVDTAVEAVKSAAPEAEPDRVVAQADRTKLGKAHDAVLPPRELRDPAIEA